MLEFLPRRRNARDDQLDRAPDDFLLFISGAADAATHARVVRQLTDPDSDWDREIAAEQRRERDFCGSGVLAAVRRRLANLFGRSNG